MFKRMRQRPKLWTLLLLAVIAAVTLSRYLHWDDRLRFLWQEHTTSTQEQADSIWLPGYRAVIQAKPLAGLAEAETSGLSWSPLSNTLFTVTGRIPKLVELSLTGDVLRVVELRGFSDPEGVEVLSDGRIAIIDERRGEMTIFHLSPDASFIDGDALVSISLGYLNAGNKGFEGVAWDARNQRMLLAKERSPFGLFSLPFPEQGEDDSAAPQALLELRSKQVFMRDLSSLAVDQRTGHVLVLSDESRMLLELDTEGNPVSFISLAVGFNNLARSIKQAEGVAIDAEGTIYIVSEPNLFYVFKKD
ncbi:SdiA-regulated domain-containing protein [Pseudomonas sp. C27(2019)]|uniref:SdiA-regulated domain-containing protein n=1 Tax=Pseudomonas sp. C27(2019) TaxID=2604941 RepID=UPI0015B666CA|nr:SdiA-regulated domain-containing protein [Pseudomonas sp. C27(2019)]